jgi:N-dimethylarginine dimethylaminohydrolase
MNLYTSLSQIPFRVDDIPRMPLPKRVLMVDPQYFNVEYVINPHMDGHIGSVDTAEARRQWEAMRDTLSNIGVEVHVIDGQPGLPDMVFCANQSLPCLRGDGSMEVIMSIMHADQRKGEVPYVENFYRSMGYMIHHLNSEKITDFEGMGDALWHTGRRLIWGGYGYRSSIQAYETVSNVLNVPVIALELIDPSFYHLDTCLCILSESSALYYPAAFTPEGVQILKAFFSNLIEVDAHEASHGFACNALCPDGKNVLIHMGLAKTNHALESLGFKVHELDTSEYLKSGGSAFCMKMMLW